MPRLVRNALFALLLLSASAPSFAQKARKGAAAPAATGEQLLSQYRFEEADAALQRELAAAKKAGRETYGIEENLRRARLGADMLRGTQRVTFIDSVKTTRGEMLSALKLGKGCGTLCAASDITDAIAAPPAGVGSVAYVNALGDKAIVPVGEGKFAERGLSVSYLSGSRWSAPVALPGLDSLECNMDFPFAMPDGVTLYFAAEGEESLGGYDLFVTRYDTESKCYLRAENLGMPFNSPANDYLLAIDEDAQIGWLVTDRNQSADTVCVYAFVPEDVYGVWELTGSNAGEVRRAAMIASVADTQSDAAAVKAAQGRLAALREAPAGGGAADDNGFYVIDDTRVYTALAQFRSEKARSYAKQADDTLLQLRAMESQIDLLQRAAVKGARSYDTANMLSAAYDSLPALYKKYNELCKKMRQEEKAAQ